MTMTINKNLSLDMVRADKNSNQYGMWKFSDLDLGCLKMYLRGTWIYDSMLDIDNLKVSLSKLLNSYAPLAGRVNKEKTGIAYVNKGVPFFVNEDAELSVNDIKKTDEWADYFYNSIEY